MEEKEILANSALLFTKYGIKSMTMDEISRQLGISKKTLYLYVSNKKDLVIKVMKLIIETEQCVILNLNETESNPIDEIMEITKMVSAQMKEMNPSVLFDLKKYHPKAWQILEKHKEEFVSDCIKKNLNKGIETGLYRENLNPEIVTYLYLSMVNGMIDPDKEISSGFRYYEMHLEMMRYHIRGIASKKGREYLKQKFSQENV